MDSDPPRAKFLCSFGGSILPRPLDARLRYVGGETRIVSLPRDVSFDDLFDRMRELFDGVAVIKYQQPDEDLDALVSVVNDDDVVNMMEEYDKLVSAGNGENGFTRLRIFLFSHHNTDPDAAAMAAAAHFDVDERESERRYVDALNNLVDTSEIPEQLFGHELNVNIPHCHSRVGEESSWSPAYYSTNSRSEAQFDHQSPPVTDNMMWLPPGAMVQEKSGFPANLGHAHNVFDGSSGICEHCRIGYQRSQALGSDPRYLDPRWNQAIGGNEYMGGHFAGPCGECYRTREPPRFYNEAHGHEPGWVVHPHQGSSHRVRMGDHCAVDGNMMNAPFGHVNYYDGHDDGRYHLPSGNEFGGEVLHAQQGVGHGYVVDNPYQVPSNLPPIQNLRRRAQVPVWTGTLYDSPGLVAPNGFVRSAQDGSPRIPLIGADDQNGVLSQKFYGADDHSARLNPNFANQGERILVVPGTNHGVEVVAAKEENSGVKGMNPTEAANIGNSNANIGHKGRGASPEGLTYLPELIASVKKAALENAEEVKVMAEMNPEYSNDMGTEKGRTELENEADGDGEQNENSKIEPTTAEAEAFDQGLQTIKNDDLEEIRELGSGTYGSVYHGKWKGCDVAIKRIKASCFTAKPSERERLVLLYSPLFLTLNRRCFQKISFFLLPYVREVI